jgi:hypothetical protein
LGGALKTALAFAPVQGDTFAILDKTNVGAMAGTFDGLGHPARHISCNHAPRSFL